jgi:hypothetical protein
MPKTSKPENPNVPVAITVPALTPELTGGIHKFESWATALVIHTGIDYQKAIDTLKGIKSVRAQIVERFSDAKQKAYEAHRAISTLEKSFTDRCDSAERIAKGVLVAFQRAEDCKAEAERREKQRIEDERVRKENERLAKEAAKAEKKGNIEKAQELRETAESNISPVVPVQSQVPEVAGASTRKTWKAEITDMCLFMEFVHEHGRDDLVLPNLKTLDAYAKAMRERAEMPGVTFQEESSLAIGGTR